ncbi:MAG: hypothetical protein AB3N20_02810 [Rhizobiaceae bacterium]
MSVFSRIVKAAKQGPKVWENSQIYEFKHSRLFMESAHFAAYLESYKSGEPIFEQALRVHFFPEGSDEEIAALVDHARARNNLEIGPSCGPVIFGFDAAKPPTIIEPVGEKIVEYQQEKFGFNVFENARLLSIDAAKPVAELEGAVDGAIYVRNCIDHSPKWPFIMSNIARYAAPGCRLIFWSEMNHGPEPDMGHYNMTDDVNDFLRFTEALGFRIDRHFSDDPALPDLGIIATKI